MSFVPTPSPQWICHPQARSTLLSITPLILIAAIARSGVYITLHRQRSTYSLQTQPGKKGRLAENEPAFSHPLLYRFPPPAHKKCLRTSLGWRFRTGALEFPLMRIISDRETCTRHLRRQELWMTAS